MFYTIALGIAFLYWAWTVIDPFIHLIHDKLKQQD